MERLNLKNVTVGIGYAGEGHAGCVLAALNSTSSGALDIPDSVVEVNRVVEVKPNVLWPSSRPGRVEQNPDGSIGPGQAHEEDVVAPIDFREVEGVTVEASRLLHVASGHDEEEGSDLRHHSFPIARSRRSGVTGTSVMRMPTASATAFATAAAPATIDGSPTMRAP